MSGITRRNLLKQGGLLAAAGPFVTLSSAMAEPANYPAPSSTVGDRIKVGGQFAVVETTAGKVKGYGRDGILTFKGIPYAASTAGKNRFQPPQPVAPWTNVKETLAYGKVCPQAARTGWGDVEQSFLFRWDDGQPGEDCLCLNVWTPSTSGKKRPVMFWIHGGGYTAGSGNELLSYDGQNLAQNGDVVVVSINHRLNIFGFLNLEEYGPEFKESANVGMLDIVAALQWVRDNISAFGGDPESVTIFGQSGGGGKVCTLMAMPSAKGLFHRAITQSGAMLRVSTEENSRATTAAIMKQLNLTNPTAEQLQGLTTAQLLEAAHAIQRPMTPGAMLHFRRLASSMGWAPVMDGNVIPVQPFDPTAPAISATVPLLTGNTLNEFTTGIGHPDVLDFTAAQLKERVESGFPGHGDEIIASYRSLYPNAKPFDLWSVIATAGVRATVLEQADKKSAQSAPVYCYQFDWQTPVLDARPMAFHCSELAFVFANTDRCENMTGGGPAARALGAKMSAAWLQFARTGNPNVKSLPAWKPYNSETRTTMYFNDVCETRNNFDKAQLDLMSKLS